MRSSRYALPVVVLLTVVAYACTSDDVAEQNFEADGAVVGSEEGASSDAGDGGGASGDAGADAALYTGPTAKQSGRILDLESKNPVSGVTITTPAGSTTTGADGTYDVTAPLNFAFSMSASQSNYLTLHEQDWEITGDLDRGDTFFLSKQLYGSLSGALDPDPTKAVVSVLLVPNGTTCKAEGGTTISVSDSGAKSKYFNGGLPGTNTSAVTGSFPTAVFYDLTPGVDLTFTIAGGSCKMAPFPVSVAYSADGGIAQADAGDAGATTIYTGGIKGVAGSNDTAFTRVFLE